MQTVQYGSTPESWRGLMEKVLGITRARAALSTLVEQVQHQGDTYIIERHGRPAAAIVPVQVYEEWKRQRDEFFDLVRQAQQHADLTPDEAERIATEAVKAVRNEI